MRSEVGFGSDHARGVLGTTRRSSTRGQGRRLLPGRCIPSEWAMGLDVAGRSLETGGAFVEGTVDMNVSKFPALEAGFVVLGMVMGEGSVMVTASPPNFGVF